MLVKKILAISGSTRKNSSNGYLLRAIQQLGSSYFQIELYEEISSLPHFNPDLDTAASESLIEFKSRLRDADGIIICSPEYAHGVPGSLKNAIDWTVGTGEFTQKPTLLITAATNGEHAHQALLATLQVLDAKHVDQLNLSIPYIQNKVNSTFNITDSATQKTINELCEKFYKLLSNN